jgi:hypothetical protein
VSEGCKHSALRALSADRLLPGQGYILGLDIGLVGYRPGFVPVGALGGMRGRVGAAVRQDQVGEQWEVV